MRGDLLCARVRFMFSGTADFQRLFIPYDTFLFLFSFVCTFFAEMGMVVAVVVRSGRGPSFPRINVREPTINRKRARTLSEPLRIEEHRNI